MTESSINPTQLPLFVLDRTCTICGLTKPLEDFTRNKASLYGRMKQCKACRNAQERARHVANPQKRRDRRNAYRRAHPEIRERERVYEDVNRERINRQFGERYAADPERYLAYQRAYTALDAEKWRDYHRRWRKAHPETVASSARRWRLAHPERVRLAHREWCRRHPEWLRRKNRRYLRESPDAVVVMTQRRRARKMAAPGSFTAREWRALREFYDNTCLRCGDGTRKVTADHVVPLACGGSNYITDLQPLCGPCNSAKGIGRTDYRTRTQDEFLAFLQSYPYRRPGRHPKGWQDAGAAGFQP